MFYFLNYKFEFRILVYILVCYYISNYFLIFIFSVYVITPMDLQIVDYILEVPVGSELNLHVALFGMKQPSESNDVPIGDKLPFSDCYTLPLRVDFDEDNFVVGGSGKPEPSTIGN